MEAAAFEVAKLVIRQDDGSTTQPDGCATQNDYDGRMGVRISAIFVILVGSLFGATFPTFAKRSNTTLVPSWVFFLVKYFGSGVIVATAFIHLLAPAQEALGNPCLTGPITEYSWVEGIILMTIFVMFFIELMVMRYANFGDAHGHSHDAAPAHANGDSLSLEERKRTPVDTEAPVTNPQDRKSVV